MWSVVGFLLIILALYLAFKLRAESALETKLKADIKYLDKLIKRHGVT